MLSSLLEDYLRSKQLPPAFLSVVNDYYLPLAQWINSHRPKDACWIVGLNGAQGTGKSTLSDILKLVLEHEAHCHTAVLSLDDLYFSRAERGKLAQTVHPLLQTRGVPGTHDTKLGMGLLDALCALKEGEKLLLPRFNKARDDRKPKQDWEPFTGSTNIVIFEGWCMGVPAGSTTELVKPVNALEANEDRGGEWRHYVNNKLLKEYNDLFARIDSLIMLKAPDFDSIHRWRWEQEQKLAEVVGADGDSTHIMNKAELTRFLQHYERLTQRALNKLPGRADVVLELDRDHQIARARYNKTTLPSKHLQSSPRD